MAGSKTLAKLKPDATATDGAIEKHIAAAAGEQPFKPAANVDDFGLLMSINRHLDMDLCLGAALLELGEARHLTGADRRAKIERAMSFLKDELRHC